jgi:hypothetical protein
MQLAKNYPDIREKFIMGMEQGTAEDFWTEVSAGNSYNSLIKK